MVVYIEDVEYGVLYLAPVGKNWYVSFEENGHSFYYLLKDDRKTIIEATKTMPDHVWKQLGLG